MSKKREIDVEQLRDLIENQKLQHRVVSAITGIPEKKMTKFCRRYGIKTQRTGPRSGEGHPEWNGGRVLSKGYWYVYSPDHPNKTKAGYVFEHRLVMEKKIGRLLSRDEVVHHIDGNPSNNSEENLVLFSRNAAHLADELKGRIPNWTDDGRKRIRNRRINVDGLRRYTAQLKKTREQKLETRRIRYQRQRNLQKSTPDACRRPRSTDHQTS